MPRPDLDLVSVHSPPFLHADHVGRVVAAGHAVLCDKPFGRNATEAEQMVGAASAASVTALVNFEFRRDPTRRYVRDLIRSDALGTIEHVTWTHLSATTRVPLRPFGWLFDRAAGGGWLGAWGAHALDALRWWLGDLTVVTADLRTVVTRRPDGSGTLVPCDAEDAFTALLATRAGASIVVDASGAAAAGLAPRLVVAGAEAVAEVVADGRVVLRRSGGARERWEPPSGAAGDVHARPMQDWAAVVCAAVAR